MPRPHNTHRYKYTCTPIAGKRIICCCLFRLVFALPMETPNIQYFKDSTRHAAIEKLTNGALLRLTYALLVRIPHLLIYL